MNELKKILKLTAGVGEVLIGCGAEISRVEDTMNRIALHYGITRRQIFIIANGVFVNLEKGDEAKNVSIRHIPSVSVDLNKLCDINSLSRAIEQENLDLDEAIRRYEHIKYRNEKNRWAHIAASGVGAGAFCYLFGGDLKDCMGALVMGLLLWGFFTAVEKVNLSKVLLHIMGSFIVTAGCVVMVRTGLVNHLNQTIMGGIIPMIPGVAFTNGIRDIADGDYISGGIRLLDAVLIFICIAAGVCIALKLFHTGM